jgi:hypothetical protein
MTMMRMMGGPSGGNAAASGATTTSRLPEMDRHRLAPHRQSQSSSRTTKRNRMTPHVAKFGKPRSILEELGDMLDAARGRKRTPVQVFNPDRRNK